VLYIIDIKDGRLIRALNTGAGTVNSPNGMSSPTALDTNSDGLVDRVYAGDIDGSVWTFDVSAKTASAWSAPAAPLYSSGQPVFGAPDVAAHPIAGTMVYFSNGQPFASSDPKDAKEATVRNYVYGIWEGAPAANTAILTQALTKPQSTQALRVSSALAVNWTDASDPASRPLHRGWRVALPAGERSVGTGFIRDGRYQLTSVSPPAATKPQSKGETWLYELDYESGGVAGRLIFDLNADKLLTNADRALDSSGMPISGPGGIPVGVLLGGGMWSQPTLGTVSRHFSRPLFNGGTKSKGAAAPASGFLQSRGPGRVGRISWRDASVQ
jgi:type IV pilus assembly protein PilY1